VRRFPHPFTVSSTTRQPLAEYDPFASIYDRHMALDFARRVMPVLDRLVLRALPGGAPVLDLCCGSGRVTQALLERRFRVTGVDASEPMLQLARHHAPGAEFVLADMRRLALGSTYAAVVSTFNSLAHVHTVADLCRVFGNARAALVPGGVMVFDISMHRQYQHSWRGEFSFAGPEGACTIRPSYDPEQRLARNCITVVHRRSRAAAPDASDFPENGNRKLETRCFTILQKCHEESEILHALAAAGFTGIENFDAERNLGMSGESGRSFFRAMRPTG
jgi:SAM-dependent methyltransferase